MLLNALRYIAQLEETEEVIISDEEIAMEAIEDNIRNKEWLTKEGKILKIKDMETSHIINCIKMINRNRWCYAYEYTKLFESELKRRGIEWI